MSVQPDPAIPDPAIHEDDPGLTAYALGELEEAEAASYAAACGASPELQAIVDSIRRTAAELTSELRQESEIPVSALAATQIVAPPEIQPCTQSVTTVCMPERSTRGWGQFVAIGASSVVAGAVCFGLLWKPPTYSRAPEVRTRKLVLAPSNQRGDNLEETPVTVAQLDRTRERVHDLPESMHMPLEVASGPGVAQDHDYLTPVPEDKFVTVDGESATTSGRRSTAEGLSQLSSSQSERGRQSVDRSAILAGRDSGVSSSKPQQAPGIPTSLASDGLTLPVSEPELAVAESKSRGDQLVAKSHDLHTTVDELRDTQQADTPVLSKGLRSRSSEKKSGSARGSELSGSGLSEHANGQQDGQVPADDLERSAPATATPLATAPQSFALGDAPQSALTESLQEGESLTRNTLRKKERELRQLALIPRSEELRNDLSVRVSPSQRWNESRSDLEQGNTENYRPIYENTFIKAADESLSTFSIDVDTASYSNLRRYLQGGQLPPPDAVRVEELVNYFAYQYPQPTDGRPFAVQSDIAACPWQPSHHLVRIGLKGREIPATERPPTNLVFLVDVSGSMSPANKLPLVRQSLTTLLQQLDERDKVAIVTYAGEAGVRLPSTSVAQRDTILAAINSLNAGGSTNGAAGINTAYDIAAAEFLDKGVNRVILCTDGDFNVGVTSDDQLVQLIQTRAKGNVFLSVFGFGMGNLKDGKLEQLADKGNGQYGYIDDQLEADKVFVQEMLGTLVTIAKDVKIQVDFNRETVSAYRLIGYENRVMATEDFHNDKKDAGEIGAGHTVTALYEVIPVKDVPMADATRWLTVKLRYKLPEAAESVLFENHLTGAAGQFKLAPSEFQFAASVAATGMLLRQSQYAGQVNWALVKELAQSGLSFDPHGHRRAFLNLVAQAESLTNQLRPASPPPPDSSARGRYKSLLRKLNVPQDTEQYGQFNDYGYSDTKSYAGSDNLPAGYWVYVAPHWYIWAETTDPQASTARPK